MLTAFISLTWRVRLSAFKDGDEEKYRVVDGQEEEPKGNMTRLDAMRYCNWKEHHYPDEKEDAVAASFSTESGAYDLQDDQLICFYLEAGDHLVDDDEGNVFFWIAAEAEGQKYWPLMIFCVLDKGKNNRISKKDLSAY